VTQKHLPTTDGAWSIKNKVKARLVGGGDCQDSRDGSFSSGLLVFFYLGGSSYSGAMRKIGTVSPLGMDVSASLYWDLS
jgi:hypothetical protein